jgi:hypothetical protein
VATVSGMTRRPSARGCRIRSSTGWGITRARDKFGSLSFFFVRRPWGFYFSSLYLFYLLYVQIAQVITTA